MQFSQMHVIFEINISKEILKNDCKKCEWNCNVLQFSIVLWADKGLKLICVSSAIMCSPSALSSQPGFWPLNLWGCHFLISLKPFSDIKKESWTFVNWINCEQLNWLVVQHACKSPTRWCNKHSFATFLKIPEKYLIVNINWGLPTQLWFKIHWSRNVFVCTSFANDSYLNWAQWRTDLGSGFVCAVYRFPECTVPMWASNVTGQSSFPIIHKVGQCWHFCIA